MIRAQGYSTGISGAGEEMMGVLVGQTRERGGGGEGEWGQIGESGRMFSNWEGVEVEGDAVDTVGGTRLSSFVI